MTQAVVGALRINVGLNSAAFTSGISHAQKQMQGFAAKMQSAGASIARVGAGLTASITAPLIALGFVAVREAAEMRDAMGQVEAAVTSMGNVAGRSLEQLQTQADDLARSSLFEDDQILRGVTANLLTFGNVATENFDRAQVAITDVATRLRMDLQPATLLVGKALNDPIRGLTAMGRAGIQFTTDQKATIKAMVEGGNAAGAQAIILGELERQFGGSAAAARAAADPMTRMRLTFASMAGDIGTILLPALDKLASWFEGVATAFGGLSPRMQQFAVVAGIVAAAIGPVLIALGAVVASVGAIAGAFAAGGFLAFLIPILPVIAAVAAGVAVLVGVFLLFRKDIEPVLQSLWQTLQTTLGPPLQAMFAAAKEMAAALGAAFKSFIESDAGKAVIAFASVMQQFMAGVVMQVFRTVIDVVAVFFRAITDAFRLVSALLRGDWSAAWSIFKEGVSHVVTGIGAIVADLASSVIGFMARMIDGVKMWLVDKFKDLVLRPLTKNIEAAKALFFGLYDAVVGHSYIPDMVEGIAEWMAKLDAGMVVPARNATEATRDAFESLRGDIEAIFDRLLTDSERAARELARTMATLDQGLAGGQITPAAYDQASARVRAAAMTPEQEAARAKAGSATHDARAAADDRASAAREKMDDALGRMNAAADEFGQRFGDALESAINGDVRGAFEAIFGDMRSILADIGKALFRGLNLGGQPAGGGGFDVGSMIASAFRAFKLPGFAQGGSIMPGGSGGIDSQVVAFRKSPGEKVDIYDPRKSGSAGGGMSFDLRGAVMTSDLLRQMQDMAIQSGGYAVQGVRQIIPNDLANRQAYMRR